MTSLYYRKSDTGSHIPIEDSSVLFGNATENQTLTRLLTFHLGIPDESYIVLNNVHITRIVGDGNIAKMSVLDIPEHSFNAIREFHECLSGLYPNMEIDPLDEDRFKVSLKRRWYRIFHKNGNEMTPDNDVVNTLKTQCYNDILRMNIQIHIRAIRTHENRILFQPLVRKIQLL